MQQSKQVWAPLEFKKGGQATLDEEQEVNPEMGEDPRSMFINENTPFEKNEMYDNFLKHN